MVLPSGVISPVPLSSLGPCFFGRTILVKVLMTDTRSVKATLSRRSRIAGQNRLPLFCPSVRRATSSKAILIAKGVGQISVLPPDDVAAAGLSEKSAVGA